jgi:transcriptional regulator GlxA family with amidase domain
MKVKTCAAFLFEGFIDHQLSLTLACLNRGDDYVLETFSVGGRRVNSVTGYQVTPHASLEHMRPEDFDVLLLPGGARWEKGDNLEIFPLLMAVAGSIPLVAVGEAVLGLADLGLLDDIPHTGCRPGYIQRFCPEYRGAAFFRQQPCVSARKIVTIDGAVLLPPGHGILGLFDTLQKISINTHELFDQEQQRI